MTGHRRVSTFSSLPSTFLRVARLGVAILALAVTSAVASAQAPPSPTRPQVGALNPGPEPSPTGTVLPDGVRVKTLAYGAAPKALIRVVIETGAELPAQCGLTAVLTDVFGTGDATIFRPRLTDSVAHMGGAFAVTAKPERIELTLEVLSGYAGSAVEMLGRIVRAPRLDLPTVQSAERAVSQGPPRTRSDVSTAALETFESVLFPSGEFGRPCAPATHVARYTVTDVRQFYEARVTPRRTTVYVVGRFDRAAIDRGIAREFGAWPQGTGDDSGFQPSTAVAPVLEIIQRPGAKQVALVVGARVPGPADSDFVRLHVADAMLGNSLISRITMNIREAKGYAYAPSSSVVAAPSGSAYWAEVTNVAAPVAWPALREILSEIQRLGVDAPPDSELTGIKRYVVGRVMVDRASRQGVLDAVESRDANPTGASAVASTNAPAGASRTDATGDDTQRMLAVTTADIRRVIATDLPAPSLTIVLAGDTTLMTDQMPALHHAVDSLRHATH